MLNNLPLDRNAKRVISVLFDLALIPAAIWLAYCIRMDQWWALDDASVVAIAATTLGTIICFIRVGLYRAILRFAGQEVMVTIILGCALSAVMLAIFSFFLQAFLPRSVPFIYFGLALITVGGSRAMARAIFSPRDSANKKPVLIYGAGDQGRQLANMVASSAEYRLVGFLDDDKAKQGSILRGVRVFKPRHLPRLKQELDVAEVFFTLQHLPNRRKAEILGFLANQEVTIKTFTGMADVLASNVPLTQMREVKIDDLLGRQRVQAQEALIKKGIANKSVMVTGAGGSIGSELARQVCAASPSQIVLAEFSEYSLYAIEQELKQKFPDVRIIPMLVDVSHRLHMKRIMTTFRTQVVFHAAAYKHVPVLEHNVVAGVRNNVLGTLSTIEAAVDTGAERFVLISSDKAVTPVNVLGATKRLAELITQAYAGKDGIKTVCSMVRFGNVLDSSGSVVPLFKKQIEAGGPVTVTHQDATRFFMTIPEAVELVLQAAPMAEGGEVFVLDMGEPIKILDLATTMIALSHQEVPIEYIGLRPGERLHERTHLTDDCVGTEHPKITRAREASVSFDVLSKQLEELEVASSRIDADEVLAALKVCVEDFTNAEDPYDLLANETSAKVIPIGQPLGRDSA